MRDIAIFLMMLVLVPISMSSVYVAYLMWTWAGLASVSTYLYTFMAGIQYSLLFSSICLLLLFLSKDERGAQFKLNRTTIIYFIFGIHVLLCAAFAYEGQPRNWEIATNMVKTIAFCAVMPMIITTRARMHGLVLMIAMATSYHGLVEGLKYVSSGGEHVVYGVTKYGDNNHFAIVMIMIIPLLVYSFRYAKHPLARIGFGLTAPLMGLAVFSTQSRGGFLCLLLVSICFVFSARRKSAILGVVIIGATLISLLAPENWVDRMKTIGEADKDSSMMGRVGAWRINSAIALQNPIFGGGMHSSEVPEVWTRFRSSDNLLSFVKNLDEQVYEVDGRAAHSIYFEILGDTGFLGFFIFIGILINAIVTAREVIKLSRDGAPATRWAGDLAGMIIISLIAFATGGALLSAAYFELPYMLFMIIQVLKIQVIKENAAYRFERNNIAPIV